MSTPDWSKLRPRTMRGEGQLLGLELRRLFREAATRFHLSEAAGRYDCRACRLTGTVTWTGTPAPCPRCLPTLAEIFDLLAAASPVTAEANNAEETK